MSAQPARRLPSAVAHLLSRLPARPGSRAFAHALNALLAAQLDSDTRQALEGRRLRLAVADAGLAFDFRWRGKAFEALAPGAAADLVIMATLHDLALLAARKEDPDTLFFGRRLVMEGDTELGLLIKNTLDALDGTPFDPARLHPARVLERLRLRLRRPGHAPS
ncbi:ubiquinone anaerobic biosynthesis accessory factor UbiT [Massilia aerilata]|uniref:Ubiquinone biosynthesis accessory factor UbiT n=1 Tax=Massilia aerilata TaxID=453817 RepID=A0ABW0RWP6_9BURK